MKSRFSNYNWLWEYPRLFLIQWFFKIKNWGTNADQGYTKHIKEFYALEILKDNSDKFDSLRPAIAKYALQKGKNKSVLEIATGYGHGAAYLKKSGFRKVVAIDLVPERIEGCKELFSNRGIDFQVADASNLPFKDKSFDASVASFGLHDMPRKIKRKALDEMIRVTKNTIVIAEPRTFKNPVVAKLYGLLAYIVDESMNIADYVADDLDTYLENKGLVIQKNDYVWHRTLNIKVCGFKD